MLRWRIFGLCVVVLVCMAAWAQETSGPAAVTVRTGGQEGGGEQAATTPVAKSEDLPGDALRLVLDYFDIVRKRTDAEFAAARMELARNLLRNIIPFLVPPKPTGATKPAGTTAPPPAPVGAGTRTPQAASTPTRRGGAPSRPSVAVPPPSQVIPAGHEGDPAYAKVPQKLRIKRKFEAAREPFKALRRTDPQKARMADELLKAARAALTKQQFDQAESYLDKALEVLGVKAE